MDALIFKRIKQLLENSGLLNSSGTIVHKNNQYDFSEETILITGAAGSIGSGLTHQLIHCKFKKLILIDNAETPLFFLKQDVDTKTTKDIAFVIADVKDKPRITHIFETYRPTLIYHTAAYKHVSIVENNAFEAIKTNIFATKTLSELALSYNSKRFIFISTDKAVNPVGIMGMTKCIAENYLLGLDKHATPTKFISARFGNIFGSNGSVVPLFIKQLNKGEQITITNKDATRLFIDKDKACCLILKLSKLNMSGYSKVSFNMGEPIKIIDLANALIAIFKKSETTKIEVSELSQGEKLHETIINDYETLIPSDESDILFIENKKALSPNLEKLYKVHNSTHIDDLREILLEMCTT
jgi:FlaA1/EpsC-like NDP-sugar epimerase